MMSRVLFFLCLCISAVLLPTWLFAVVALWYALTYTAYELLIVTAAIDAFYGGGIAIPYYTIIATVVLLLLEWVKPRLSVYN